MKNIFLLLFSIAIFTACDDDLDLSPISQVGANGFFNSPSAFEQGVAGAYANLGVTGSADYPSLYVILGEARSDNMYCPGTAGVRDWNATNNFLSTISTLGTVSRAWNLAYVGIMRANTVLDQLATNSATIGDDDLAKQYEAEMKFLRAYFYFDLVKWYGPVPLMDKIVSPEEALEIPRAPVTEVYDLIISDLEFAIANLPNTFGGENYGRANALAARGVLARVYLTRSGPQDNPNGPCLASGEYQKAADQLDAIINSNQFEMLDDYAAIWDYNNEGNSEIVWDINFISGGLGAGGYYPTEYYDEAWGRANLAFPGGNPGDGGKRISDDLLNAYEEGDLRFDVNFLTNYIDADGVETETAFIHKFTSAENAGGDRFDWSLNYPVLRYTDVLMMRAEATLQGASGWSQDEVDGVVNDARDRAGLGPVSGVDLDMLLEERRREFAGENLRWDVLVRTGKAVEVMNAFKAAEDASNYMQTVKSDYLIYPLPQDQLDVKAGLYDQNPGYN